MLEQPKSGIEGNRSRNNHTSSVKESIEMPCPRDETLDLPGRVRRSHVSSTSSRSRRKVDFAVSGIETGVLG